VLFTAVAVLLGGTAGTLQWPIVGTFFEAIEAAPYGAVVGVFIALVTWPIASERWAVRLVGGLTSGGAARCALLTYSGPVKVTVIIGWSFVIASAALGVVVAPMVASGVEVTSSRPGEPASERFGKYVVRGLVVGSGLGGVVGLIVGLFAYAPTAPFALIEGGILGAVTGVVASLLVATAVLLPKVKVLR